MSNPGLVGYSDSDTDSEQEGNGIAPAANTGVFRSTSVRHVSQKQDAFEHRSREVAEGPPLKRRREDNPSTGLGSSARGHVEINSQEQGTQLMRSHPVSRALSLPSAILDMFKEGMRDTDNVRGLCTCGSN